MECPDLETAAQSQPPGVRDRHHRHQVLWVHCSRYEIRFRSRACILTGFKLCTPSDLPRSAQTVTSEETHTLAGLAADDHVGLHCSL